MKFFHFSLQPLRVLRQHREDIARERYAECLRGLEAARSSMELTRNELTRCWDGLQERLATGMEAGELLHGRSWCDKLERLLKERAAAVEQARKRLEGARRELMIATQEREGLDRLFEKRRNGYRIEERRHEQKELDEVALQLARISLPLRPGSRAEQLKP